MNPVRARLELSCLAEIKTPRLPFIKSKLTAAHALLNSQLAQLQVLFVGDAKMSRLHKQFLGIAGPTDVLTFPSEFDGKICTEGEIAVCVPEARRRAKAENVPVSHELLLYALHGMMHLSGFDDVTPRKYQRMHRFEDQILKQLGVGAVFLPRVHSCR